VPQSNQNQSTFQRCPHDRQNPYVQISREMAQDKSITPASKGVLLYLLSLPPTWKIYHSQLQEGLGVGDDYIRTVMDDLIKAGYVDRTRERVNGSFGPYHYTIREFKKCSPNRENRSGNDFYNSQREMPSQHVLNQTGFAGPVNPAVLKKETEKKEKEKKHPAPTAPEKTEAQALLNGFYSSLLSHIPGFSPQKLKNTKTQVAAMERLRQMYGKETVEEVIESSLKDPFWIQYVHTATYLEKKFETLLMRMKNKGNLNANTSANTIKGLYDEDGEPMFVARLIGE